MKRVVALLIPTVALVVGNAPTADAEAPTRQRELTCSDGTTFTGQQVRQGGGRPPHSWRIVSPETDAAAFNFHSVTVTAPDGTVVRSETWDNTQGVDRNQELITCSFTIPIGPFTGYQADFEGFFVPVSAPGTLATPALSRPPTGSASTCPPRYDPMTLPEILAQAQRLGIPEEMARALFQLVNKNEDDWICQRKLLPGDPLSYNFVDNQAMGLDV